MFLFCSPFNDEEPSHVFKPVTGPHEGGLALGAEATVTFLLEISEAACVARASLCSPALKPSPAVPPPGRPARLGSADECVTCVQQSRGSLFHPPS